jgi:dihydrofolate reductase
LTKVFFDVGMSLDGFIAGLNGGPKNPLGDGGLRIHEWMFETKAFRQHLKTGDDGKTGLDNDLIEQTFRRIGANIMGRRMFDEGELNWPDETFQGSPVFVLTHHLREPWRRNGGNVFYFTDEPMVKVLEKAMEAAKGKDVRISGGASVIQQFLGAGFVDDFSIHIAPVMLGSGVRLFQGVEANKLQAEVVESTHSPRVSHLRYRVLK